MAGSAREGSDRPVTTALAPGSWSASRSTPHWHRRTPGLTSFITYLETLLDENATCHLAWGAGLPPGVPSHLRSGDPAKLDAAGVNTSRVHVDFMVGGPDVAVTGLGPGGRVELLRENVWQF
ncbi:aminopeptidase [Nonomuraea sp. NPDC049400]|uniref:aminopeptidase n=1 Tax=Nonomuraea sp. NPDC049400 TaxID=3364352 RepID=UPI0037A135E9